MKGPSWVEIAIQVLMWGAGIAFMILLDVTISSILVLFFLVHQHYLYRDRTEARLKKQIEDLSDRLHERMGKSEIEVYEEINRRHKEVVGEIYNNLP